MPDLAIVNAEKAQSFLEQLKPAIMKSLARQIPDTFWAGAMVDFRRNPKLGMCTSESVIASVGTAYVAGVQIGDGRGSGWLVPFKNHGVLEAQLMIGYRAIVNQAYNCPRLASILCEVVREGDVFEYELGTARRLKHVPIPGNDKPITYTYMVAEVMGSQMPLVFVMDRKQVDAVKARSQAVQFGGDSPWFDKEIGEAEMTKKTVLRRGAKQLPFSVIPQAMASVLEQEDAREFMNARQAEIIIHNPAAVTDVTAEGGAGVESGDANGVDRHSEAGTPAPTPPAPPAASAPPPPSACISEPQRKRLWAILLKGSTDKDDKDARTATLKDWMQANLGHAHTEQVSRNDYEKTCKEAESIALKAGA